MMKNFWNDVPRPFYALAPMEAVTDVVFRHVVQKAAPPDVYFTEFTNATGWYRAGEKAIGGRLVKANDESPIAAQLWGSDPEAMAALATQCAVWGYDGIDINMGCPDQSAIRGGGGAQMIRTPDVAAQIIASAKESGLPVSVKTRLGYTHVDEWREWLTFLLHQDIAALTIHLRAERGMGQVPGHFELIREIKQLCDTVAPHTPRIINGDIHDRAHGQELADTYGIDGVMIGRGIFANPYAFAKSNFDDGISNIEGSMDEHITSSKFETHKEKLINLLSYHLDQYDQYSELTKRPFETLKRFFKIYIRDFDGASDLRTKLMNTHTTNEVRELLKSHRHH